MATPPKDYIKALRKERREALQQWENVSGIEKDVQDSAFQWVVDNVKVKNKRLFVSDNLPEVLDGFIDNVMELAQRREYKKKLVKYTSKLTNIKGQTEKFYNLNFGFDLKTAGITSTQKAVVNDIIRQFTGAGLNRNFATPLRDLLYRNILGGIDMLEAKTILQGYILSGRDRSGKLKQYLTQTALQGLSLYEGAMRMKMMEEFHFTGLIIEGPIIKNSSEQCIYAINHADEEGYLPFGTWKKIIRMAEQNERAKALPGTTVYNLPLNKLHWGCIHDFIPTVKE